MALAIPLLVMIAVLASAWGLGVLARGRSPTFHKVAGAVGVVTLFALPLAYEATVFDGLCYDAHAATTPCTLSERLWHSLELGFAFTVAPAVLWLAAYAFSARLPK